MTLNQSGTRMTTIPWIAVAGELITALCFGSVGLFFPINDWVTWPELLLAWHFGVGFFGSVAIAIGLARRNATTIKLAIVLATYIGVPNLIVLSQAIALNHARRESTGDLTFFVVAGIGALAQFVVVVSCLGHLKRND